MKQKFQDDVFYFCANAVELPVCILSFSYLLYNVYGYFAYIYVCHVYAWCL